MHEPELIPLIPLPLDGGEHRVPAGTTLAGLVTSLGHAPQDVTTALNGVHVARDARSTCLLQPGDAVLLFQPIVGG
jgi:sulfur carrier protein